MESSDSSPKSGNHNGIKSQQWYHNGHKTIQVFGRRNVI